MTILKLANEGDTHTGRIVAASEVAGNFGPQVKFSFEGGDDLFLPKDSADRQLARIPLAYAECVGEMLTFSRDPNAKAKSKPYWGIKLATGAEKQATAQPSKRISYAEAAGKVQPFDEDPYKPDGKAPTPHRVPQAPDPTDDDMQHEDEGFERFSQAVDDVAKGRLPKEAEYFALFERVAAHQAAVAKKHGFPIDGSSVQATTFSIFKSQ